MKKLTYIVLIGLFTLACTKKNTVRISVKNAVTGKPIPGASIYISEIFNVSDGVSGSKTEKFYSGNTNSEGLLYVPKRFNNHRTYNIFASLDTANVCWQNSYGYLGTKDNFKKGFDFEFAPCAYLEQDIVNVNCEGATDIFSIRDRYLYTEWTGWTDLAGCFSNTGGGYSKVPAGTRIFQWKVARTSGTTTGSDTIVFAEVGYETLTIHY